VLPLHALVASGAARLAAAGMAEPRRLAVRLWADLTGGTAGETALRGAEPVDEGRQQVFQAAIGRVARGEPVQYVTGMAGFRRLTLRCDRRALIPRPETEGLVELALALAPRGRALDLGTGSGCIALALADEGRYDEVTGVDRSADAIALARENAGASGLRVRWVEGDWCAPVAGQRFDLVVANPPYISGPEWEALDPSVRDWEPSAALTAGPDGMADIRRLLAEVPGVLAPGGWLVMEIDSARGAESAEAARRAGWTTVRVSDDLFGRPRYLAASRES
jgi:release factor glutamine methyltransferase